MRTRFARNPRLAAAPRARPRNLEDQEQMALMGWARTVRVGSGYLFDELIHCPNGGLRTAAQAGRFKAMGVKAGVPDLQLPIAAGDYIGAWWELKVGKNKPTELQLAWHERLRARGHYVATFWDWTACAADILVYLRRGKDVVMGVAPLVLGPVR